MQSRFIDYVINETEGIPLSRQQIFALTMIRYTTGNLYVVATGENTATSKHFVEVYKEALSEGEANSWKFNRYIWKNWWSIKWQDGYAIGRANSGWLKGRDASFETYVKGTMFFEGGSVFDRTEFKYYSTEEIRKIGFSETSPMMSYAQYRDIHNETAEKELFTYVETTGTYQTINDADRFGIYTSSSGRTYIEWIQTTRTGNSYGQLECFTTGKVIGSDGCNVYAYTMLLNSIGLDVNPGIVHEVYRYEFKSQNDIGTMENVMEDYGVNGKVVTLYQNQKEKFISVLQEGRGIITWVGSGYDQLYTKRYHWLAVADIRDSQLGSSYGYDVYVLTSAGKGRGWQPIETIIDNMQSDSLLGYYIQD